MAGSAMPLASRLLKFARMYTRLVGYSLSISFSYFDLGVNAMRGSDVMSARRGGSAIDSRTTRHEGYRLSQTIRKRIEEHFGWGKMVGRIRQTVYRGLQRVDQHFKLTMAASNIMRIARMPFAVPQGVLQ